MKNAHPAQTHEGDSGVAGIRVIGVLDLLGGLAVHAHAGDRDRYQPVRAVARHAIKPGNAAELAAVYLERLHIRELYAADLDAILGRGSQDATLRQLAERGTPLWLDAGVSSSQRAQHAVELGASHVVVGLETLPSFRALREICDAIGGHRVAFSLDLQNGEPVVRSDARGIARDEPAHSIAARAADSGAGAIIVIDLARVGTGRGLDAALIGGVREAAPELTLLAGGGIRGPEDLRRLDDAGCDGALVATALHDGRIGPLPIADVQHHSG